MSKLSEKMDIEIRNSRRYYFAHNPQNTMLAEIFNKLLEINGTYEFDYATHMVREKKAQLTKREAHNDTI